MSRNFHVKEEPPLVAVQRPPEFAEQVRMLCGGPLDFFVYRWWSVKPGVIVKPAHVIVRTCTPPDKGVEGSVSFTPDHDSQASCLTLPWDKFFETYEPSPGMEREAPFMHDPICHERSNYETADRAHAYLHADRTMARRRHETAVAREADPATRVNS